MPSHRSKRACFVVDNYPALAKLLLEETPFKHIGRPQLMKNKKIIIGTVGRVIGLAILLAAAGSVFLVDWRKDAVTPPSAVRPLKTMLVGPLQSPTGGQYPGKVRANQEVNLAFQVAGQIIELPIRKGLDVSQGDVLAKVDSRDYESRLQAKQGVLDKTRSDLDKIQQLFDDGNAGRQELVDAKAAFDVAEAEAKMAQKALEDTTLRAPFSGVIANTFAENFEDIQAKQPILSLQDVTSVEIVVNIPEAQMAVADTDPDGLTLLVTFDYLPGKEFRAKVKEFSTEADPLTQTYAATAVMPAPEGFNILPGMTATLRAFRDDSHGSEPIGHLIPLELVPVDGSGNYFVWLVEAGADGMATVKRVDVEVGEMTENKIVVTDGLKEGDRIAAAGVHFLTEGQKVRPLETKGGNTTR